MLVFCCCYTWNLHGLLFMQMREKVHVSSTRNCLWKNWVLQDKNKGKTQRCILKTEEEALGGPHIPDLYDYRNIQLFIGKQITFIDDSPLNQTIALTMFLMVKEIIYCRNLSMERKLFLSVSFTHIPDTVRFVILLFLTRTSVNTSSFRRSWFARNYGHATLDGPGVPLHPWGKGP